MRRRTLDQRPARLHHRASRGAAHHLFRADAHRLVAGSRASARPRRDHRRSARRGQRRSRRARGARGARPHRRPPRHRDRRRRDAARADDARTVRAARARPARVDGPEPAPRCSAISIGCASCGSIGWCSSAICRRRSPTACSRSCSIPSIPTDTCRSAPRSALRALTLDDVIGVSPPGLHAGARHGDRRRRRVARSAGRARRRRPSAIGRRPADVGTPSCVDIASLGAPPSPAGRVVTVHRPGAAQSELRIGHIGLPRSTPDYHALLVMNMILGGQFVSRINMNLREEKGYTYGARTSFEFRKGPGPVRLPDQRAVGRHRRGGPGGARRDRDDPRRSPGHRRRARARPCRADARLSAQLRDRRTARPRRGRSSRSTACPTTTSRRSCRRCSSVDQDGRDARRPASTSHPARLLTVIVGDREKVGADARRAQPRRSVRSRHRLAARRDRTRPQEPTRHRPSNTQSRAGSGSGAGCRL